MSACEVYFLRKTLQKRAKFRSVEQITQRGVLPRKNEWICGFSSRESKFEKPDAHSRHEKNRKKVPVAHFGAATEHGRGGA